MGIDGMMVAIFLSENWRGGLPPGLPAFQASKCVLSLEN